MIVWKVVEMPGRTSRIAKGKTLVEYPVDVKVFPKVTGTPLFAYKTKDVAENSGMGLVVKCEAEPFRLQKHAMLHPIYVYHPADVAMIKNFWSDKGAQHNGIQTQKGTILCEWIRPLE